MKVNEGNIKLHFTYITLLNKMSSCDMKTYSNLTILFYLKIKPLLNRISAKLVPFIEKALMHYLT